MPRFELITNVKHKTGRLPTMIRSTIETQAASIIPTGTGTPYAGCNATIVLWFIRVAMGRIWTTLTHIQCTLLETTPEIEMTTYWSTKDYKLVLLFKNEEHPRIKTTLPTTMHGLNFSIPLKFTELSWALGLATNCVCSSITYEIRCSFNTVVSLLMATLNRGHPL